MAAVWVTSGRADRLTDAAGAPRYADPRRWRRLDSTSANRSVRTARRSPTSATRAAPCRLAVRWPRIDACRPAGYYIPGNVRKTVMESAITVKGQATIPKAIRDHLRLKPG